MCHGGQRKETEFDEGGPTGILEDMAHSIHINL